MPALTLVALCTKACLRNIQNISDVGDFEYWRIRTILARITSPEQLHRIEIASPQILGEDAELWKAFIQRDIPNYKNKNYVPKNPLKWYEVYMRYKKEYTREIERDKEKLREAMLGIKKEKETHVSKVVNAKYLPKVPKDPRMLANDAGVPIGGRKRAMVKPGPPSLSFAGGSKTKMKDGASVLTRARREAKEISSRNKLGKPTHSLTATPSQVLKAPRAMVDDYRKAAKPQVRIFAPRKKPEGFIRPQGISSGLSVEEREQRLRALTVPSRVIHVGSDSEKDSEEDLEDLFGETVTASSRSPSKEQNSKHEIQHSSIQTTATRPQASKSHLKFTVSPSNTATEPKPSELISLLISRPRPQQSREVQGSPEAKPSISQSSSKITAQSMSNPMKNAPSTPPMPRKRPPVDIFNRSGGAKRPRV